MSSESSDPKASVIESLVNRGRIVSGQWVATTDSTNDQLRRELMTIDVLPPKKIGLRLLVADHQTAGRGRSNKTWFSPDGALMCSLFLPCNEVRCELVRANPGLLGLLVGFAVAQTCEKYVGSAIHIKWPNDVILHDRKVSGILIESVGSPSALSAKSDLASGWIIGVGVNVRVDFCEAPDGVRTTATSLHEHCVTPPSVPEFLEAFVSNLVTLVSQTELELNERGSHWLVDSWSKYCWLTGKTVEVTGLSKDTPNLIGTCNGISPQGFLRIVQADGSQCEIASGTVRIASSL